MATAIGTISGVTSLATTTLQVGILLYNAVKSYAGHQTRVTSFLKDLLDLIQILGKLEGTIKTNPKIDFSALESPLQQCNNACHALHEKFLKCSSGSNDHRTSVRDWFNLRYMGEDVDGILRLLAGYKATINIALEHENLRITIVTAEKVDAFTNLLNTAREDLEDRLVGIDGKINRIINGNTALSEAEASELGLIEEERLCTKQCLDICAQMAEHIDRMQFAVEPNIFQDGPLHYNTVPWSILGKGWQGCKDSITRSASELEEHEKKLLRKLVDRSKTAPFREEDSADLARLGNDRNATRQSLHICSAAQNDLNTVSVIENHAVSEAFQAMLSTEGKALHGKNNATGPRVAQLGGVMGASTAQMALRSMSEFLSTFHIKEVPSSQTATEDILATSTVSRTNTDFKDEGCEPTVDQSGSTESVSLQPADGEPDN